MGVLDPADPSVPDASRWPAIQLADGDLNGVVVLAARADGSVLAEVPENTARGCRSRLVLLNGATGVEREQVARSDRCDIDADVTGTHWVTVSTETE
jgi:hypothetical protein